MESNLNQYLGPLRKILLNEEGKDRETLIKEFQDLSEDIQRISPLYLYEDPDFDEVATLQRKIQRNYSSIRTFYSRDPESQLSFYAEGHSVIPFSQCPYDDDDEASIYKPITEFIAHNFVASNPHNKDDGPFLTGEVCHQVSQDQMRSFVELLTEATHKAAKHIAGYATPLWAWEKDIQAYAIYTFERFYELAYKIAIKGEDVKSIDYNPTEVYSYRVPEVPDEVESYMLKKEAKLIDIIEITNDMIEKRWFYTCHTPLWIRTFLFQMGLGAFRLIGESKEF